MRGYQFLHTRTKDNKLNKKYLQFTATNQNQSQTLQTAIVEMFVQIIHIMKIVQFCKLIHFVVLNIVNIVESNT